MAETLLPETFRKSSEKIVSYSWEDLASGQSYLTFYLIQVAGTTYKLVNNATATNTPYIEDSGTAYTFSSSVFTTPRVIYGMAMLETAHRIIASGTVRNITINGVLKLNSTTIGTFTQITDSAGSDVQFTGCSTCDIPLTQVKVGDILNLEITVGGSTEVPVYMYIDPQITTAGALGTSKLYVPFKIQE